MGKGTQNADVCGIAFSKSPKEVLYDAEPYICIILYR
jgi:hypothetical protein